MTEQPTYEQRPYPGYLMIAWNEAFKQRWAAEQVARELKALVTRENQARRAYADASAARTAKEAEHADLLEAAQGHEEMTALWCREHDRQLPPPPPVPALPAPGDDGQTRPQELPAGVPAGVVPVWQEPPRQSDPLTDPLAPPPPNGQDVRAETAPSRPDEAGERPFEGLFRPDPAPQGETDG